MSELDQFLKDTNDDPNKVDVLEAPLVPEENPEKEELKGEAETGEATTTTENDDELETDLKPRNRRERRLMQRLSEERESASFIAGKLEARTEANRALTEEADYLKAVERIYGTDTPEAQLATDLLKKAITGARDDAKRAAIEELREEQRQAEQLELEAQRELDDMLEDIEDTYNVALTENQQAAFFQLLERMSPKDRNGEVREYADPHAVWEVFTEKLKSRSASSKQQKSMASRSMASSSSSTDSKLVDDVQQRFLREQGII
jgi:hypothetical protein